MFAGLTAAARGWRTRIKAVLRAYMEAESRIALR
jgi:uncharacterized protein (DUF4415 family)